MSERGIRYKGTAWERRFDVGKKKGGREKRSKRETDEKEAKGEPEESTGEVGADLL